MKFNVEMMWTSSCFSQCRYLRFAKQFLGVPPHPQKTQKTDNKMAVCLMKYGWISKFHLGFLRW